jgi:enterochelin esterase-like enzyme
MKKALLYITFFFICLIIHGAPLEKEGLIFHSNCLKQDVLYSIILPENYDCSKEDYPVLFMFHGIGGDYTSWLEYGNVARVSDSMIKQGKIKPFIMVIPNGFLSYYCNKFDGSFSYETFFIKEFLPYIERTYRVHKDALSHSVIGFSMGGFGALSMALRHRDLFGSVVALSPSIRTDKQYENEMPQKDWDQQWGQIFGATGVIGKKRLTDYYKTYSPYHILSHLRSSDLNGFGIMLNIGDKEGTLCESNEELHRLLLDKEISHKWNVHKGGHDFDCWNAALPEAFQFVNSYFCKSKLVKKGPANPRKKITSKVYNSYTLCDATVYTPIQAKESSRKYPIIYIQGTISTKLKQELANSYYSLINRGKIWPVILCFLDEKADLYYAIENLEKQVTNIRNSQRMRGLIILGKSIQQTTEALKKNNLFTGIVIVNAICPKSYAQLFADLLHGQSRYSRCWIDVIPNLKSYDFSSDLHIFLRKNEIEHEYRSRYIQIASFSYWKEWLDFLNQRIHV